MLKHTAHCVWCTLHIVCGVHCTLCVVYTAHCVWCTLHIVCGVHCTLCVGQGLRSKTSRAQPRRVPEAGHSPAVYQKQGTAPCTRSRAQPRRVPEAGHSPVYQKQGTAPCTRSRAQPRRVPEAGHSPAVYQKHHKHTKHMQSTIRWAYQKQGMYVYQKQGTAPCTRSRAQSRLSMHHLSSVSLETLDFALLPALCPPDCKRSGGGI